MPTRSRVLELIAASSLLLLTGCTMGHRSIASDRITLTKGQNLHSYQLVGIDAQGRAEFRIADTGDNDYFAHTLAAPGQHFGLEVESNRRTHYDFTIESTNPATQQATILAKVTTP